MTNTTNKLAILAGIFSIVMVGSAAAQTNSGTTIATSNFVNNTNISNTGSTISVDVPCNVGNGTLVVHVPSQSVTVRPNESAKVSTQFDSASCTATQVFDTK